MNFFSLEFTIQFVLLLIVYWSFKRYITVQNIILLLASYAFLLQSSLFYAGVLFFYTVGITVLAQYVVSSVKINDSIDKSNKRLRNKLKVPFFNKKIVALLCSIFLSIVPLLYFKYTEFFLEEIQNVLSFIGLPSDYRINEVLAPFGISYYTFNCITYLVSLYRKELKEQDYLTTALYIGFFPTISAGPIFRANELIPQIHRKKQIGDFSTIFILIALVIIKKWWLASWLADKIVNPVFDSPTDYSSLDLITAVYGYAIQIYFDFSGYTDLVGAFALLLGYKIPLNFNSPYSSVSLRDFWHRWHISLSSWIRDYIYIPLGGNRKGFIKTQIFLAIGMMASGLWHGSTANFLIWAALHTVGVILLNIWTKISKISISKNLPLISKIITFHYVCLTWIFFRATDVDNAFSMIKGIIYGWESPIILQSTIPVLLIMVISFLALDLLVKFIDFLRSSLCKIGIINSTLIYFIMLIIIISISSSGIPEFIYSQF